MHHPQPNPTRPDRGSSDNDEDEERTMAVNWSQWAYLNRNTYSLPDDLVTEDDWVRHLSVELGSHFRIHVRPELCGKLPSGKRVRADMVLSPAQTWGGAHGTSHAPFILEVKRNFHLKDVTEALGQAVDYTQACWDVHRLTEEGWPQIPPDGRMLACILWLPQRNTMHLPPSGIHDPLDRAFEDGARQMLERIAGRMNVMILTHSTEDGWAIYNSGNRQWSERLGMANTKFHAKVKEGCR